MQNEIFTVRHLERTAGKLLSTFVIENWPIPHPGSTVQGIATEASQLAHPGVVNVQLNDLPPILNDEDPSLNSPHRPPPPLSIYLRQRPQGFIHISMWPHVVHLPPTPRDTPERAVRGRGGQHNDNGTKRRPKRRPCRYRYSLSSLRYQRSLFYPVKSDIGDIRILPGAFRAFIYSIPSCAMRSIAPPVISMGSYISPEKGSEISAPGIQDGLHEQPVMVVDEHNVENVVDDVKIPLWPGQRKQIRSRAVAQLFVPPYICDQVKVAVSAIVWDESVGRVCIATQEDGQLHVMDFAHHSDTDEIDRHFFAHADKPLLTEQNLIEEEEGFISDYGEEHEDIKVD